MVLVSASVAVILMGTRLVGGHGMLLDPPGRSSMWRFFPDQPPNYNDNGINCGGYGVSLNLSITSNRLRLIKNL